MAHKFGLVSFIGRPNAGKSTLLNRLVGTKLAIVSDKPQTTRTRIHGVRTYSDAQVVFVDTPGIHRPLHRMNVQMVDAAIEAMREVDVVGLVVDASEPTGKGDKFVADLVRDVEAPVILILNKVDLMKKTRLLPIMERYGKDGQFAEIVPVSASTGENVDRLERLLIDLGESHALLDEVAASDRHRPVSRFWRWRELRIVRQRGVAPDAVVVLDPSLGGEPVVVPAHRIEDGLAAHAPEARDEIGVGVGIGAANVK